MRDYQLSDAFNALGRQLFVTDWTRQEIEARKVQDPGLIRQSRAPFESEMAEVNRLLQAKDAERRQAVSKDDLARINSDFMTLERRQQELFSCLNELGWVRPSEEEDRARWQRFEKTEAELMRAFREGELYVFGANTFRVDPRLWTEMPEGFGWNWSLSLIFWPSDKCARPVDAAKINCAEFEDWLARQLPLVEGASVDQLPAEQRFTLHFRKLVKSGPKPAPRDKMKRDAMNEFPGLSGRAFQRVWDKEAPDSWTDLPPLTGSKRKVREAACLGPRMEGKIGWHGSAFRSSRSSITCGRRMSFWRKAGRSARFAGTSAFRNRVTTAGAGNMAA